jgi:replicative DNA helicase
MKVSEVFKNIDSLSKNTEFLPTGFPQVDEFLDGGLLHKELIVLGGASGSGKSFLAGQIFFNIAKQGFYSAYFSLEISNEMVVSRLMGQIANIKPTRIMAGLLDSKELDLKMKARAKVSAFENSMDFYDDIYQLEEMKKIIKTGGYEFVVIDFIQNVVCPGDEYTRLSTTALELQRLAKECNCCILVLSQLSNQAARSGIAEYKGSGSIATVCDLGFFIERDPEDKQKMILALRKNRRGISNQGFPLQFAIPGGKII